MAEHHVPTVDDLRVKLCYICREEERYDQPENPPRAWIHACNCTLVAHETCLLQWIQSAQSNPSRARNALKCPQCGTQYELESDNPRILRLLAAGNKVFFTLGRVFISVGVGVVLATFGSGIYILSTSYGAYAVQQFLGKEMYDLLLTDDPSNWPWHAFFNLPLIPISLILSRTPFASHVLPVVPLLLTWPTSTPVPSRDRILVDNWTRPGSAAALGQASKLSFSSWPPSPVLFGLFIFPMARILYRRAYDRLSHWVLDTRPGAAPPVRRFVFELNAPFAIQIGADIQRHERGQEAPPDPAPAPAAENAAPEDPAAAAAQVVQVYSSSIGRVVGGALLIPAISNAMGALLYRLARHSPVLRAVLAVRPPRGGALGLAAPPGEWKALSGWQQLRASLRIMLGVMWGGTRVWTECDPVWWRNSIGLGLFVAAKDCIHLLHLWLTKRELESRRVKNRSFEGVDLQELDVVYPLRRQAIA